MVGVGRGACLAWGTSKLSGVIKTWKCFICWLCGWVTLSKLFKLYT